jgi:hypothetical protein
MKAEFETHENSDAVKDSIMECLSNELLKRGLNELRMPIFTCLNEMLVNAIKANYKNLYFEEYAPRNNALEIIPYHKALQLFKLEMSTNRIDYLLTLAREKNVTAVINIEFDDDNMLTIRITNPACLTEVEEENIKKKIEMANSYATLTDYFLLSEQDPNKEGGGLGIIFIIMMLKSFGLPTDSLSIFSEKNMTIAELRLALNNQVLDNYIKSTLENE